MKRFAITFRKICQYFLLGLKVDLIFCKVWMVRRIWKDIFQNSAANNLQKIVNVKEKSSSGQDTSD